MGRNEENQYENIAKIGVIGVGGGGNNAVDRMIMDGMKDIGGISFIAANTDLQVLNKSHADIRIQLGKRLCKGLGAGADPSIGSAAAEEDRDEIKSALEGLDMLFIAAGMGGGTGTGASPVIASIAKELNILTVAIVTTPFKYEQNTKMNMALEGIEELKKYIDTIIIIPNQKLVEVYPKMGRRDAYKKADETLSNGARSIASVLKGTGHVNIDFADFTKIMKGKGLGHIGFGFGSGKDKVNMAIEAALKSPLLDVSIEGAAGVIFSTTVGKDTDITMEETDYIAEYIAKEANNPDILVIDGDFEDENLKDDEIIVTIIATGIGNKKSENKDKITIPINNSKSIKFQDDDDDDDDGIQIPEFLRK